MKIRYLFIPLWIILDQLKHNKKLRISSNNDFDIKNSEDEIILILKVQIFILAIIFTMVIFYLSYKLYDITYYSKDNLIGWLIPILILFKLYVFK